MISSASHTFTFVLYSFILHAWLIRGLNDYKIQLPIGFLKVLEKEIESERKDYELQTCWKWYSHNSLYLEITQLPFQVHKWLFKKSLTADPNSHRCWRIFALFMVFLFVWLVVFFCVFCRSHIERKKNPPLFPFFVLAYLCSLNRNKKMSHFRRLNTDSWSFRDNNISIWMAFQNQIEALCCNSLWRFSFTYYALNNMKGLHISKTKLLGFFYLLFSWYLFTEKL